MMVVVVDVCFGRWRCYVMPLTINLLGGQASSPTSNAVGDASQIIVKVYAIDTEWTDEFGRTTAIVDTISK